MWVHITHASKHNCTLQHRYHCRDCTPHECDYLPLHRAADSDQPVRCLTSTHTCSNTPHSRTDAQIKPLNIRNGHCTASQRVTLRLLFRNGTRVQPHKKGKWPSLIHVEIALRAPVKLSPCLHLLNGDVSSQIIVSWIVNWKGGGREWSRDNFEVLSRHMPGGTE